MPTHFTNIYYSLAKLFKLQVFTPSQKPSLKLLEGKSFWQRREQIITGYVIILYSLGNNATDPGT